MTDQDSDKYVAFVNYAVNKDIQVGLLGSYIRDASNRAGNVDALGAAPVGLVATQIQVYSLQPYFKAKFGPVALEGEVNYAWGDLKFEDDSFTECLGLGWRQSKNQKPVGLPGWCG